MIRRTCSLTAEREQKGEPKGRQGAAECEER